MNTKIFRRMMAWTSAAMGAIVVSSCAVWTAAAIGTVILSSCAVPVGPANGVPAPEDIVVTGQRTSETGEETKRPTPLLEAPRAIVLNSRAAPGALAQARFRLERDEAGQPGPLASVLPGEELWIIATPSTTTDAAQDEGPGSGAMLARFVADPETSETRQVPLPLKHTDVRASIGGYISTVHVRQQFQNPFNEKIEAVYLFPLPSRSAVSEFLMIIGERRIRGILREKEEAEAIYNAARAQGYQASLLVQHRPNIFEQKVANIEPGKAIDVDIRYFHTLAYEDGWYSFVFPTVVGPRYNPPGSSDPIVPVPRGSLPVDAQTSVPYLRPDERSAHDLRIEIAIDAGVAIEELKSSHEIVASRETPETASIQLAGQAMIPNRDFILKFRVAGNTIKSNLLTYVDPDTQQGYFTLMLYPPSGTEVLARRPMEMVFVLDCSGSMSGRPLEQARAAVTTALAHLQEGDTFQIIRFSDNASQFGTTPVPATAENLRLARHYLENLNGMGGTEMIEGIKAALDFPHDPARLRFVSFLTDGYIGNEADIIAAVHDRIGSSRIFSFGVGSAVNRYLLERMAKEGRGAVAYLGPEDSAAGVMNRFFDRISHPALTDVTIDWSGMAVTDVYPSKLPDLFVGRPVVVTGKYLGPANAVTASGIAAGVSRSIEIAAAGTDADNAYLPQIWARLRIAELSDRLAWEPYGDHELEGEIRRTALEYQLMSDFTSFVAVDSSYVTEGTHGYSVHQAIPVPEAVRYDTTVQPVPVGPERR
jgi:Ca-activated chloride channel homolog